MPSYDKILETSAVLTSIIQFLSGIIVCRKWIKLRTTGDASGIPYLWGFLSCSFWLRYGVLTDEKSVAFVNLIGASLFFLYLLCYYVFTPNRLAYLKQFGLVVALLFGVILWTSCFSSPSEKIYVTGIICCFITVCYFSTPLTMLFHVIRLKNSDSLPFPLIITAFLTCIQWLIYGILISDTFIQIPNFLGCILSMSQLSLFVCYPPKSGPSSYAGQGYKLVENL